MNGRLAAAGPGAGRPSGAGDAAGRGRPDQCGTRPGWSRCWIGRRSAGPQGRRGGLRRAVRRVPATWTTTPAASWTGTCPRCSAEAEPARRRPCGGCPDGVAVGLLPRARRPGWRRAGRRRAGPAGLRGDDRPGCARPARAHRTGCQRPSSRYAGGAAAISAPWPARWRTTRSWRGCSRPGGTSSAAGWPAGCSAGARGARQPTAWPTAAGGGLTHVAGAASSFALFYVIYLAMRRAGRRAGRRRRVRPRGAGQVLHRPGPGAGRQACRAARPAPAAAARGRRPRGAPVFLRPRRRRRRPRDPGRLRQLPGVLAARAPGGSGRRSAADRPWLTWPLGVGGAAGMAVGTVAGAAAAAGLRPHSAGRRRRLGRAGAGRRSGAARRRLGRAPGQEHPDGLPRPATERVPYPGYECPGHRLRPPSPRRAAGPVRHHAAPLPAAARG